MRVLLKVNWKSWVSHILDIECDKIHIVKKDYTKCCNML